MGILKNVLIALVGLVVILLIVAIFLPDEVHVERSTTIAAPPAEVFTVVNDLRGFNRWSPWAARDPDTRYTYEGPESGVGARMSWASENPQVGSGSQEIVESRAPQLVRTRLDFGAQGTAMAFYELEPTGNDTRITWGFDTELDYPMERYLGLMLDKWVGADYEAGLANLKDLVENRKGTATSP